MDWALVMQYVLSGLIVWGVGQLNAQMRHASKWRRSVDRRLSQIEMKLDIHTEEQT
jgi:hypothetical protein